MADNCIQDLSCRNEDAALHLKAGAICAILVASTLGVVIPIVAKTFSRSVLFFIGKCFAAGVILATGFVHILPDAYDSLTNSCLPPHPWSQFPFAGFIAMLGALATLAIDSSATSYYHRKACSRTVSVSAKNPNEGLETGTEDIIHAHHHRHNHDDHVHTHGHHDDHVHDHGHNPDHDHGNHGDALDLALRSKVTAEVLELGIITHSIIIGISLGASQSPCTIRPLIAALSFHQFFEGLALGGCISIGGFGHLTAMIMGLFFSFTTPIGIAIGIGISSVYNENGPTALVVEGVFDSISGGILVYMALVDLIASEFLTGDSIKSTSRRLLGYASLLGGAFAMALLAIWA